MRKTRSRSLALALALLFLLAALPSCKVGAPSDEQARDILAQLLPGAKELLTAFYGQVPLADPGAVDPTWTTPHYLPVSPEFPYGTIAAFKEAASRVFSQDYLAIIYEYAFEGTDDYMPRFGEDEGVLTVDVTKPAMGLLSEVDAESARVLSGNRYSCRVAVEATSASGARLTKEVSLAATEDGGWRIDSAVY